MYQNLSVGKKFLCVISLSLFFWGCADQDKSFKSDGIVRKKITVSVITKPDTSPKSESEEKAEPDNTAIFSKDMKIADARTYTPEKRIDPFALPPFIIRKISADDQPPIVKPGDKPPPKIIGFCTSDTTPLSKFGLNQLKLVGIIRAGSGNRALIQEASNKGYIVRNGTCIGIHFGRVSEILEDRIVIEEKFEDYDYVNGKWQPKVLIRERELVLNKNDSSL